MAVQDDISAKTIPIWLHHTICVRVKLKFQIPTKMHTHTVHLKGGQIKNRKILENRHINLVHDTVQNFDTLMVVFQYSPIFSRACLFGTL